MTLITEPFESKHIKREESEHFSTLTLFPEKSNYSSSFFKQNPSNEAVIELLGYLEQFFKVYANSFKNIDEREPIRYIFDRIFPNGYLEIDGVKKKIEQIVQPDKDKNHEVLETDSVNPEYINDQTIIQLCFKTDMNNKEKQVVGGMILEYYANRNTESDTSFCILTYLFVDENQKRKGLGKALIKDNLPIICNNQIYLGESIERIKPSYVFFEVDNPRYINDVHDIAGDNKEVSNTFIRSQQEEECIKRLNFFNNLGARWLDISYVQPKLSEGKSRVYNLLLMVLIDNVSSGLRNPFIIAKKDVLSFIVTFYNTLESNLDLNIKDFAFENENIVIKDSDITRSWLIMEISDAIDEFESVSDEKIELVMNEAYKKAPLSPQLTALKTDLRNKKDVVVLLKYLKAELDNQFDFIADNLANTDISHQHLAEILQPVLIGEPFLGYSENLQCAIEDFTKIKVSYEKRAILSLKDIFKNFKSLIEIFHDNQVLYEDGSFYLKEIPKFTVPRLQFDKASVAFHIAVNSHLKFDGNSNEVHNLLLLRDKDKFVFDFDKLVCPIFGSYQNDLMAYNYYGASKTPVKSKNIGTFDAVITFPSKIEFLSEGRKESFFINVEPDRKYSKKIDIDERKYYSYQKRIKCLLNVMYFKPEEIDKTKYLELVKKIRIDGRNSSWNTNEKKIINEYEFNIAKNFVWELIFTNQFHEADTSKVLLSEFEIIQLSKFFSGKQEKSDFDIDFKIENQLNATSEASKLFEDIFKILQNKHLKNVNTSIYDVHAGTIQIDTENVKILKTIEKKAKDETILNKATFNTLKDHQTFKYVDLFEREGINIEYSSGLTEGEEYGKKFNTENKRIKALLEEYLKDNVDNIKLQNDIYLPSKPAELQISSLEIYRNIREFHFDDLSTGFEDRYNDNGFLKYFFDTLCGFSLGIFDFERMGYEEVTDTISPLHESVTDKAFIVMKRSSLFSCCHKNSVYESSINTIGISPYLIIPNSVLVYNLLSADENKAHIEYMFSINKPDIDNSEYIEKREYAKKALNLAKNDLYQLLIGLRKKIEIYNSDVLIPNIFNYSTEQEIYLTGMKDRGVNENVESIIEKKKELEESIKDTVSTRQTIYGILMTIFLGVVSFIGIWDSIVQHIDVNIIKWYMDVWPFPTGNFSFNLGPVIFWSIFLLFIVYFGRQLLEILPQYFFINTIEFFRSMKVFFLKLLTEILRLIKSIKLITLFIILLTFSQCTYKKVDIIAIFIDENTEVNDSNLKSLIDTDLGHIDVYSFAKGSIIRDSLVKLYPQLSKKIPFKDTSKCVPLICYSDNKFKFSLENGEEYKADILIWALPLDSLKKQKLCSMDKDIFRASMIHFVKQDIDSDSFKLLHNVYYWGKHPDGENSLSQIISHLIAKSQEKEK